MPRPILSYKTIRNIVTNREFLLEMLAHRTIPVDEEKAMIDFFNKSNNDSRHPLIYRLNSNVINFFQDCSTLDLSNFDFNESSTEGYQVGIYIRLGKPDGEKDFQGVIEPVATKKPEPGNQIDHKIDKLISSGSYMALDLTGKTYDQISRKDADKLVKNPDGVGSNPTIKIYLDCSVLINFINNATDAKFVFFQFARNAEKGRLTLIVSCSAKGSGTPKTESNFVNENGIPQKGFALDDHDLIP